MRKKYYAQPHQKARTAQDHLNVKLNIFCLFPIKLGHPHPTCQKNKNPSWFHRIIRKTFSGASPPNLPKKQKTKLVPQNHQKNYFCGT
jgi:hypothetical protein